MERRQLFARQFHVVGLGGVAAQHREPHLGAGLAAQQALALEHRSVAGRLAVDGANVVAGHQAGARGRRPVA